MIKKVVSIVLTVLMICSTMSVSVNALSQTYLRSGLSTDVTYSGDDLGATYTKEGTTFKVWAPTASKVILNRYSTGSDSEPNARLIENVKMTLDTETGVWSCYVKGDIVNTYYTYSVTVDGDTKETQDVYSYATGVNGNRTMVVDLKSTDPVDWEKDNHVLAEEQTDAVIWEVHVRDFSISATSGVSEENKGKYLAFTEGGTTVNGETANGYTCIDYLVDKGIKYVHLNPVYDFGSVDETRLDAEQYNWGYDPINYNVPDGSYSSDPYNGNTRITEFKMMIQALHDRGIGVIMDVVYNHTYSTDSCFQFTVPDYYYRMKDGHFTNGSGCGNEMATEKEMYRKYVIESVRYWAKEYHIDGFRFDLMAMLDITTMNKVREGLDTLYADGSGKKLLIYGEPWVGDYFACALPESQRSTTANASKLSERIAFFNDNYRDAVKGSTSGTDGSFIQNVLTDTNVTFIKAGLSGNMGGTFNSRWTSKAPTQNVLYQSAHDNLTLYDKLYATMDEVSSYEGYNETAEKLTMIAQAMTLTGQGIPFVLAGEEFSRTKFGDENSYSSNDEINALDWERTLSYAKSADYYKGLIQIRDAYSPFSDGTKKSGSKLYFCWSNVPDGCIAYTLENELVTDGSEWAIAAVLVNSNKTEKTITLEGHNKMPSEWTVIANSEKAGLEELGTVRGTEIKVPAQSALILVDKASFDSCNIKAEENVTITVNHYYKAEGSTETKLLKTTENLYTIGDTFRIKPDNNLSFYYRYTGTEDETTGTVENDDYVINFYYTDTDYFPGVVYVNYYDENGEKIKKTKKVLTAEGKSYHYEPAKIQGYQLDTSKLPAKISGKMEKEDIVIDYYYKALESNSITVHYWNTMSGRCYFYCYTEDESKPLGAWPGKLVNQKDSEGYNVLTVEGISEAKFVFNNSSRGDQDPGANMPGYDAYGEVWIKDRTVTFNTKIITSYVTVDGEKLQEDDVQDYTKVTKKGTYNAPLKDFNGYKLAYNPGNASGVFTPGIINVVYVYRSAENIVSFDANGGVGAPDSIELTESGENKIPTTVPSNGNKEFLGWSADPENPDSKLYQPGDSIEFALAKNGLTLYAVWKSLAPSVLYGDVDNDGFINMVDVTTLQKYIASIEVDSFNETAADVTGDGEINMVDVTTIQRFIASLIDKFPADENGGSTEIPTDTDSTTDSTTDSVSDVDTDTSTPTDSDENTDDDYTKIYFQNNWLWTDVSVYAYYVEDEEVIEPLGYWPGTPLELCDFTYEGYEMYTIEVPKNAVIIFNGIDEYGNAVQSIDLDMSNFYYNGFKMAWYDGNHIDNYIFEESMADSETDMDTDTEDATDSETDSDEVSDTDDTDEVTDTDDSDITTDTDDLDSDVSTDSDEDETRKIYFRNDWLWTDVKIYSYDNVDYRYFGDFPGTEMELTEYISEGYEVYTAEIPLGTTIIFSGIKDNGSGTRDQSPDIKESDFSENCFCMVWHGENDVMNFNFVPNGANLTVVNEVSDTATAQSLVFLILCSARIMVK